MESADVVPLVLHPEPSVTRLQVLQTLEATGRPYSVVGVQWQLGRREGKR